MTTLMPSVEGVDGNRFQRVDREILFENKGAPAYIEMAWFYAKHNCR
jgi:hypothetical protein